MTNDVKAAALNYRSRGWQSLPLRPRSKVPVHKTWTKMFLTEHDIETAFQNHTQNIGIILGEPSGNLIDVDLDCPEAVQLAKTLLPATDAIFGRKSTGLSHYLYQLDTGVRSERLKDSSSVIIEIRSDGAQTMVPPSIHPCGEQVTWAKSGDPAKVDAATLRLAVHLVAAGVVLVRGWPKTGRHDCSLAVGAILARAGIAKEVAATFMQSVCELAADEEAAARVRNLDSSYDRMANGEAAYGLPKLAEIIGEKPASLFAKFVGFKNSVSPKLDVVPLSETIAKSMALWVSKDDISHATIEVDGHKEHLKVRSRRFRKHLIRNVRWENGRPLTSNGLDQLVDGLDAQAQVGPLHETAIRVAIIDNEIYIDLVDERWRAIRITAEGWSIVDNPPVRFLRNAGMRSLPIPVQGEITSLRPFVNVSTFDDFVLYVAAIIGALVPGAPHVILMISGEQGTAKTTLANVFKALVDPNAAPVRTLPRKEQDLFISAINSWLLCFDNVSYIPSGIADALCRITSGGAFAARQLYTDDEEVLLEARRPVLINGIPVLAQRPDLLDRCILLTLPVIEPDQRRPEKTFKAEFDMAKPGIMGAICSALSSVLRNRPNIELPHVPRMADFAVAITAAEAGLGWGPGTFLAAYEANQEAALTDLASQDPLIEVIGKCLSERAGEIKEPASELLRTINSTASQDDVRQRTWPKLPNQLTRALRRLSPVMRAMGIEVELDYERDKVTHVKTIRISSERFTLPKM